jgi:hypothetical protein
VIEHFSERRAEIVEHMRARGESTARAAQVATLETRRGKDYGVPVDRLREQWRARATEHGLDHRALERVIDRFGGRDPEPVEEVARRLEGPEGLTRERSTFSRRKVVQAFAQAAAAGARVEAIEHAADAFLVRDAVVALGERAGEARYTTRELLRVERELLDGAEERLDQGVGRAQLHHVDAALAERPSLSPEQRELVDALAWGGDGVQVVRAPAGTGKTFRARRGARGMAALRGARARMCAIGARGVRGARPGRD